MRIAIDGCTWGDQRGHGRFTREIVRALAESFSHAHEIRLVCDVDTAAGHGFPAGVEVCAVETSQRPTEAASADGARSISDILRMSRAFARLRPDVVFFPNPFTFVPMVRRVPMVLCIHDAMPERWPDMFFPTARNRLNYRMKYWIARRQAHRLITPTRASARDIAQHLGLTGDALVPVGEAASPVFAPVADAARRHAVASRYGLDPEIALILYVGGVSPHKNLHALLEACAGLSGPWQLAFVGEVAKDLSLKPEEPLEHRVAALGLEDRVRLTGYVPDADLAALYSQASFLVLPSLYEGFGLPVIEAMACGTPAAVSDRGALPEVAGDAALFFDPTSVQDMRDRLEELLTTPGLRAALAERAPCRARQFSWPAVARNTMSVLSDAAGGRG